MLVNLSHYPIPYPELFAQLSFKDFYFLSIFVIAFQKVHAPSLRKKFGMCQRTLGKKVHASKPNEQLGTILDKLSIAHSIILIDSGS
jgi:hypothetical protein